MSIMSQYADSTRQAESALPTAKVYGSDHINGVRFIFSDCVRLVFISQDHHFSVYTLMYSVYTLMHGPVTYITNLLNIS
jgi:hypothetical protein